MKEKAIIPSLREKRRYLAYRILSEEKLSNDDVKKAIEHACRSFMGELDYSRAGIMMMGNVDTGVVRVNNKYLNKVRAGMMLMDNIDNHKVIIETIGVSGILKKARGMITG